MIFLIAYFSVLTAWLLIRRTPTFSFPMMTTVIWLTAVLVSSLGLVEYPNTISYTTVVFVIACHSWMLIGFVTARGNFDRAWIVAVPQAESQLLGILSVIFVGSRFSLTAISGMIPIVGSAQNIAQARADFWTTEASVFESVVQWLAYPAVAFAILIPWFWKCRRRGMFSVGVVTFLALIDHALGQGGRALFVFVGIGMVVVYFLCHQINFGSRFFLSIFAALIVFQLGSTVYLQRNPQFVSNIEFYVKYNCAGGYIAPEYRETSVAFKAMMLSSCYAGVPVRNLDEFTQFKWHHSYGAYNGGIFARDAFIEVRERIAGFYRSRGYAENPWATSMRDFWLDFGYWAVLVYFPLGYAFASMARRKKLVNEGQIIRYALIACAAFMIPFQSPLVIRYLVYPIMATFLIRFTMGMLPQKRIYYGQLPHAPPGPPLHKRRSIRSVPHQA